MKTLMLLCTLLAQEDQARERESTVTVTATRLDRDVLDVPRALNVVDERRLRERNPLSVLDAADDQPGVWVEKRTTTTSDIVLRGLSGSNVLALIDGNTLSTFWGEGGFAGDDMYGKIDADSVERMEIIRGPASVLYGSNALGGVVNFLTRSCPLPFPKEGLDWGSRTKLAYGSAATEYRARQEFFAAAPQARFIVGGSWREVHDAEGGRGVGTQKPTGGNDLNFDAKAEWRATDSSTLMLSTQVIDRDKVRRFYKATEENFNDRLGVGATWKMDEVELRAYYQYKEDRRMWNATGIEGFATWETFTAGAQSSTALPGGHFLTYGASAERTDGESPDDEQFTKETAAGDRKAAPDSVWIGAGAYVQDEWDVAKDVRIVASARVDRFWFETDVDAEYVPPGPWDPAQDEISEVETSLTGGVGAVWSVSDELRFYANGTRGYRLWPPRFGATKHAWGVVVPSGLLPPVVGDTAEVGVKGDLDEIAFTGAVYHTWFRDWQVIEPGTFQGSTWFDWDSDSVQDPDEGVYVTRNVGHAYVYGVELGWDARMWKLWERLPEGLRFKGGFAWNIGKNRWDDEPVRHTVPAHANLALRWDDPKGWWFELGALAARRYDRIPSDRLANDPGYRTDPQNLSSPLVRPWGLPGYTVLGLRGGATLAKGVDLTIAVENITDKKYRRAHSRWDELGTNVLVGLTIWLDSRDAS